MLHTVAEYRELSRKPGMVAGQHGDVDAALAREQRIIEAEYVFPTSRMRQWSR